MLNSCGGNFGVANNETKENCGFVPTHGKDIELVDILNKLRFLNSLSTCSPFFNVMDTNNYAY